MAVRRLGLTRDQLAKFLDEHEQIRQFELLFTAVDELQTEGLDSVRFDAGAALAGVNKLAGVVAQLAQDGAIEASNALSVAQAAERALVAIEGLAMVGATLPPPVPKRRNVGAWHDMTRQTAAAVNTGQRAQCDTTDLERGVWRDSTLDVFYVADAGVYNIEFSAQVDSNKGSDSELWVWLAVNGSDVPESASVIRVKGNDGETVAAWNWMVELAPNDYFSIIWAADSLQTYLETFAASAFHPAIPSLILTVTQEA
jgi:hypothetical protein